MAMTETELKLIAAAAIIGFSRSPKAGNRKPAARGTLGRVKTIMDKKKGSNIGLDAFIKLNLMYRILGDRIANRLLRSILKNPLICMTNVGILDLAQIAFGDLRPRDALSEPASR